jgi:hypothetical protein
MQHVCFAAAHALRRASAGHVPSPRPPDQCRRRRSTYCAGVSDTDIGRGGGVCSTEQAPESLILCCHSLPSDGLGRPFRARTLTPLLRPIFSVSVRSGKGARAGMLRGMGWNGAVCTDLRTFTMCRIGYPRGGPPRNTPQRPGTGCPV